MSDNQNFGFGKFVPGFDFLQNLAKGASQNIPQMPNLANWVAPTLNVEELEKRITELKAVHFWLDQNSKALGATIQALGEQLGQASLTAAQISASASQQATGISQIRQAMRDVNQATQQALTSTRQTERAVQDLNAMGQKLKGLLSEYGRTA